MAFTEYPVHLMVLIVSSLGFSKYKSLGTLSINLQTLHTYCIFIFLYLSFLHLTARSAFCDSFCSLRSYYLYLSIAALFRECKTQRGKLVRPQATAASASAYNILARVCKYFAQCSLFS